MSSTHQPFRNISDTARFVALLRAFESERSDALFHDPFARDLATGGDPSSLKNMVRLTRGTRFDARTMAVRTKIIDDFILRATREEGVDVVLNLASGLDTRPYRLEFPPSVHWIETDLPEILNYKRAKLRQSQSHCPVEFVEADLTRPSARRAVLEKAAGAGKRVFVLTEGLLMYLRPENVRDLARDLLKQKRFQYWATDILSPAELQWIQRKYGHFFKAANAEVHFGPEDPSTYFGDLGWEITEFRSFFEEAPLLARESRPNYIRRQLLRWAPEHLRQKASRRYGFLLMQPKRRKS